MANRIIEIFNDENLRKRIQKRLPYLFHLAELECSRAGKIGMEVGSMRERILVALLLYSFGEENVETEIPITEPEVDVKLFDVPISIKTITGKAFSGVKLIWTVDAGKALEFVTNYYPICDILLTRISWNDVGGLYFIPLEAQKELFERIGRESYIKLPKPGTNPRGIEISKDALTTLTEDQRSKVIDIIWEKGIIEYNTFKRWVDYWDEEDHESQS